MAADHKPGQARICHGIHCVLDHAQDVKPASPASPHDQPRLAGPCELCMSSCNVWGPHIFMYAIYAIDAVLASTPMRGLRWPCPSDPCGRRWAVRTRSCSCCPAQHLWLSTNKVVCMWDVESRQLLDWGPQGELPAWTEWGRTAPHSRQRCARSRSGPPQGWQPRSRSSAPAGWSQCQPWRWRCSAAPWPAHQGR